MDKLNQLLQDLEQKIELGNQRDETISEASVIWHINHSFMVVNEVSKAIFVSNPLDYQWKFNKNKFVVFLLNKIPRGKAKAPAKSRPFENFDSESTQKLYNEMLENLLQMKNIDKNCNFKHPIFGVINKKDTLKFLYIHTKHHANIVDEVLKK